MTATHDDGLLIAQAALATGRRVRLCVQGDSMVPTLRSGQRIEVVPLGAAPVEVGDVVACDVSGRLVVHRVVGTLAGSRLLTQGDACGLPDRPLPRGAVLGRVVAPGGRALPPRPVRP